MENNTTQNTTSSDELQQIEKVASTIVLFSSCLSLAGGFFIIYSYIKIKHLQESTPRKLLVYLTIADLIQYSFYCVSALHRIDLKISVDSTEQSDTLCEVQSFMTTFGSISMFFWTDIMAVYLFAVVKLNISTDLNYRKQLMMHAIGWVLPGLILIAPISFEKLGGDESQTVGPWCWLKTNGKSTDAIWLFITGKGYELLTYVITSVLYIAMKLIIHRTRKTSSSWIKGRTGIRQEDEKFWLTWIIMLILRLPGTIRTFLFIDDQNTRLLSSSNKLLMYMQSFGDPGQAFVNCIIYCFLDKEVRLHFKEKFMECKYELCSSYEIIKNNSRNTELSELDGFDAYD